MKRTIPGIIILILLTACGGDANESSDESCGDVVADSTQIDSVNVEAAELPQYLIELNGTSDLDLFVIYETWAEGDYLPIDITYPDGTTESVEMSNPYAHIYQFDGSDYDSTTSQTHGVWYADSLWSDDDDVLVFEKGTIIDGPWMVTAIEKEIYAEPSEESELLHSFTSETYINVIVAWKNWVRVSAYTSEKNVVGWCKTRYLDDLE